MKPPNPSPQQLMKKIRFLSQITQVLRVVNNVDEANSEVGKQNFMELHALWIKIASAREVVMGALLRVILKRLAFSSEVSELLEPLYQPLLSSTKAREGSSGDENVQKNGTFLKELHNLAVGTDIQDVSPFVLQGLELVLNKAVKLEDGGKTAREFEQDIMTIGQRDALLVFRTLCKMGMKEDNYETTMKTRIPSLELLQYATRIFVVLLLRFSENLKVEIGIFFPLVVLRSLDGSDYPLNLKLSVTTQSRISLGTQNVDPNSVNATQIVSVKGSSLQCLVSVMKSLVDWEKLRRESKQNEEQKLRKILQVQNLKETLRKSKLISLPWKQQYLYGH
ncbi:hypothetical protein Tco_0840196 [Tanacetum coccineum]|uniref:Uncharacterized protein n=1 Tax=Tanacetum coccineum TaxID=301880 RepID=A0ABQ5AUQ8_9ASTR